MTQQEHAAASTTTSTALDGSLVGYARVSTRGQDLALQLAALEQADCARVFQDVGSGTIRHRPELARCLDYLRAGDTLVVWRLDRLGRSLRHLVEIIADLETVRDGQTEAHRRPPNGRLSPVSRRRGRKILTATIHPRTLR